MRIKLLNFKCYKNSTFVINDLDITLLSGRSGAGKTSLLQSICWCLYGGIRGVYNNNTTGKCSVTVEINGFIFYRQGRPNLLKITIPNGTNYEDIVAQQIIDNAYGDSILWYATSYIGQDTRSILINGSNSDRMNLLNKLSFNIDDPEECINRIDVELKSYQNTFRDIQAVYEAKLNLFTTDCNKDMSLFNYYLDVGAISDKEKELIECQDKCKLLLVKQKEQEQIIGKISYIKSMLQTKNNELLQYNSIRASSILPVNKDYDKLIYDVRELNTKLKTNYTDKVIKYEEEIKLIQKKISELTIQINNYKNNVSYIMSMYNSKKNELSQIDIDITRNNIIIKSYEDNKIMYEHDLQLKTEKVSKLNIGDIKFVDEDIWKTKKQDSEYIYMTDLSNKLSIEYNTEYINAEKKRLTSQIEQLSKMEQENKIKMTIDSLNKNLDTYNDINNIDVEIISNLQKQYSELKQGINLLECPHCTGSLYIQNGKLIPSNMHKVNHEDIQKIESQINQYISTNKKYQEKVNIQKQIESLQSLVTSENPFTSEQIINEKNKLMLRVNEINKLKYVDKPLYSEKIIQTYLDMEKSKSIYDNFIKSTGNINDIHKIIKTLLLKKEEVAKEFSKASADNDNIGDNKIILAEYNIVKNDLSIMIATKSEDDNVYRLKNREYIDMEIKYSKDKSQDEIATNNFMVLIDKINKIENEIKDINDKLLINQNNIDNDIVSQIQTLNNKINELQVHINKAHICQTFYDRQTKLNVERDSILEMHADLTALGNLRQIAIDLECEQLQSTVNRINTITNEILENIFEQPITATLKLYKLIKSNKRIKPSVNLVISYDGNDYDGVKMLSGGEKDRISLALIIAMNRISNSPFLFLDESMRSINNSLRESSIESIRNILSEYKTIVCINHEDTEGYYDNVIKIDYKNME